MRTQDNSLLYFADPMCSWCWGFTPVIEQLRVNYGDQLPIALVLGGLRPGTTEPLRSSARKEILHHWQSVSARTKQPFDFNDPMPDGFVYDTEPASRAVVAMGEVNPVAVLPYFSAVQEAFYAKSLDVTQAGVLLKLSEKFVQDSQRFEELFNADSTKQTTQAHFQRTRQFGVRGFPSLILQTNESFLLLSHGYRSYPELEPELDEWLEAQILPA